MSNAHCNKPFEPKFENSLGYKALQQHCRNHSENKAWFYIVYRGNAYGNEDSIRQVRLSFTDFLHAGYRLLWKVSKKRGTSSTPQ